MMIAHNWTITWICLRDAVTDHTHTHTHTPNQRAQLYVGRITSTVLVGTC